VVGGPGTVVPEASPKRRDRRRTVQADAHTEEAGAPQPDDAGPAGDAAGTGAPAPVAGKAPQPRRSAAQRWRRAGILALATVAAVGVIGSIDFGVAWSDLNAQQQGEAQARAAASRFLVSLTNFDAKTVDADFSSITAMATGDFATQANRYFNSSIRQELEVALASSRGQIRDLYVQSYGAGQAVVYAVVDQLYANNRITTPQSDVLRVVVNLARTPTGWKVSDVTVLTGPSLGSGSPAAAPAAAATTPTTAVPAG
jgi:hypothetical protein